MNEERQNPTKPGAAEPELETSISIACKVMPADALYLRTGIATGTQGALAFDLAMGMNGAIMVGVKNKDDRRMESHRTIIMSPQAIAEAAVTLYRKHMGLPE